jgi:DNA-binding transcriptional LysR family regulator
MLCAAPTHLPERVPPHAPAELGAHVLLEFTEAPGGEWRIAGDLGEAAVPLAPTVKSNDAEVIKEAALSGAGVALLGTFLVGAELRSGRLVDVLAGWEPVPRTNVYALMPSRRHAPGKTRAFVEFLGRRFGGVPPWER